MSKEVGAGERFDIFLDSVSRLAGYEYFNGIEENTQEIFKTKAPFLSYLFFLQSYLSNILCH